MLPFIFARICLNNHLVLRFNYQSKKLETERKGVYMAKVSKQQSNNLNILTDSSTWERRVTPSEKALVTFMVSRVPVMLISPPGMGKTATIRSIAKNMNYRLITLIASRMDAQDVSGFPTKGEFEYKDENGNVSNSPVTEFAPQVWQKIIMQEKKVILFLDEFSNAHPSVRASLLSVLQDREFPNGEKFPKETIVVGAMNPTDSAADGYEIDPATSNRIAFIAWKPDYQDWLSGMKANWGMDCGEQEQNWRDLIYRFISENPGWLHKESGDIGTGEVYNIGNDSSDKAVSDYAWASRRSWDNLAVALGNDENSGTYVEDLIMLGLIGPPAATHFRKWLDANSKLNVKEILKAPENYKNWENLGANDVTTILSSGIDGVSKDNIFNLLKVFEILAKADKASMAASHISDLTKCHHKFRGELSKEESKKITESMFNVVGLYSNITSNESH